MAEAAPERITDLLKDDDFHFDEEDQGAEADKAETPRAAAAQQPEQQTQQQGQGAAKRVPIPVPARRAGSDAAQPEPSTQQQPQLQNGGGKPETGGAAALPPPEACRYFIIKSNSEYNIKLSVQTGVWSTKRHNEVRLNEAFRSAANVMLVFSYAGGGQFDGYARMASPAEGHRMATWEGGMTMGGTFDLEWRRAYGLRWEEVAHLRNPLNEDKPVKISRDGQELPPDLGHALLLMIEEGADRENIPRPKQPERPAQTQMRNGGFQGNGGPRRPPFGGGGARDLGPRDGPMPGPNRGNMGGMGGSMMMGPMGPMFMPGPGFMGPMGMNMMDAGMMGMFTGMRGPGMAGPRPPPPRPPSGPPPNARGLAMGMGEGSGRRGMVDDRPSSSAGGGRDAQLQMMEQQIANMQRMLDDRALAGGRSPRRYHRSRSRSRSPRWSRRSPSPPRRSPRRSRDLGSMTYDEYLADYQRGQRRGGGGSGGGGGSRDMEQMSSMMANMQRMLDQQRGSSRGDAGFPASGRPAGFGGMRAEAPRAARPSADVPMTGDPDPTNMTEAEYVTMWEQYSRDSGEPFDAAQVRGWYRSFQASRAR